MPDIEYLDAPQEVLDLATKLVRENPESDFTKARIKYLMKPMKNSKWAGRCHLAHGPWRHLLPVHFHKSAKMKPSDRKPR